MTTARSASGQQGPPAPEVLRAELPRGRPGGALFREHELRPESSDGGCWWFSSSGEGRFDLRDPRGTCYLGETEGVATRERCGRLIAMGVPVTEHLYRNRVVTEVLAPELDGDAADLTAAGALRAGVTGELAATTDYGLSQEWAAAIWGAGFEGLRYPPRFTPGGREAAWALFGRAGARPGTAVVRRRTLLEVLADLGHPTVPADELTEGSLDVRDGTLPQ